jgi:hypothetical protein
MWRPVLAAAVSRGRPSEYAAQDSDGPRDGTGSSLRRSVRTLFFDRVVTLGEQMGLVVRKPDRGGYAGGMARDENVFIGVAKLK